MKKFISIICFLVVALFDAQSLTNTENYIYSRTYLEAVTSEQPDAEQIQAVRYLDGLGRTTQSIGIKASPNGKDIVVPSVYDGSGRQTKSFLPQPVDTQNGAYISGIGESSVNAYYGVANAYSEVSYEKSPLARAMQSAAPGTEWQMGGTHTQKIEYLSNDAGEVKRYKAATSWNASSQINDVAVAVAQDDGYTANGYYKANTLYKMVTKDENDNEIRTFINSGKQTLLVRRINKKANGTTENLDTYYVYNESGGIAYVIPPKASVSGLTPTVLNSLCYQYKYDKYNRVVEKKIPGKGWEYLVYDQQGRVALSQDASLRAAGNTFAKRGWLFNKYDKFGRTVYTGFFADTAERPAMQAALNTIAANANNNEAPSTTPFTLNGMDVYYTKAAFPAAGVTILSVNYYDEYPAGAPSRPSQVQSQATLAPVPSAVASNGLSSVRSTKTLPTASYTKNIENDSWSSAFIWYDTLGRVIGTDSRNHLGGYTRTEAELDFSGATRKAFTYHARKADEPGVTVKERFVYDAQKRLKQHYHQVDERPEELLTDNTYNDLSQVINKKVGNNLQNIEYTYNIRGWLTHVNRRQMNMASLGGKLFAYRIKYTEKEGVDNPDPDQFPGKNVAPRYDGNIAETDWRAVETIGVNPPLTPKRYGYSYDSTNRLSAGYYQNPNNPYSKENTEVLDYDLNGNISSLYRTSVIDAGNNTATVIDKLTYAYSGNQATGIADASQNPTGYEGGGAAISYDANGNMTGMPDKGISSIEYNYLDLPNFIEVDRNGNENVMVNNLYNAEGTKLRKESTTTIVGIAGSTVSKKTTDYLDGFQYLTVPTLNTGGGDPEMLMAASESRRAMEPQAFSPELIGPVGSLPIKTPGLQFFATAEGYYDYRKDQYIYQYVDQLGNVRVSYGRNSAGALEITDANDYYPFGMNHLKTGNAYFAQGSYKSYKYNGKEIQETGMYSYGWREYMPDIGRWNGIDQLAEDYLSASPYSYVLNNPISLFDPDGRVTMAALTQAMWDQTPDGTNSYWQNSSGSESGGKPGGGGGSFVYVGGTAGLYAGYGIGSTLDFNGSFNSYYGTVTNGVLNYMYWTNATPASGNSIQGLNAHKASLNLSSSNSTSTSWDAYKNWADWGSSTMGGGFDYVAKQRTTLYNSGYWIDNLGNQRTIRYAGRAADSQIGLRSNYLRTTAKFGKFAKGAGYVGYAINAGQIGYGVYKDGGKFGVRAQVATVGVAGGLAGAAAGGWALGKVGGAIGTFVGPEGTVAGAAIGGIIGGIVGGFWGGEIAEGWANGVLNKADY